MHLLLRSIWTASSLRVTRTGGHQRRVVWFAHSSWAVEDLMPAYEDHDLTALVVEEPCSRALHMEMHVVGHMEKDNGVGMGVDTQIGTAVREVVKVIPRDHSWAVMDCLCNRPAVARLGFVDHCCRQPFFQDARAAMRYPL